MNVFQIGELATRFASVPQDVGSLISGGLSLIGGLSSAGASSDAANAQVQSADQAEELQKEIYDQTRTDLMPWTTTGTEANSTLGYLMGLTPAATGTSGTTGTTGSSASSSSSAGTVPMYFLTGNAKNVAAGLTLSSDGTKVIGPAGAEDANDIQNLINEGAIGTYGGTASSSSGSSSGTSGTTPSTADGAFGSLAQPFSLADFQEDPGYQFQLQQGDEALTNSLSAKGDLLSGAGLKAIDAYNQGMANTEYQQAYSNYNTNQNNLFSRLDALSTSGQNSAAQQATAGSNYANSASNLSTGAGNATAAGIVGSANSINSGIANAMYNPYTISSLFGSQYGDEEEPANASNGLYNY